MIGKHGAGTDNIDVEAARAAGVAVLSTPGLNAESVADLAVGFALSLVRDICGHTAALRAGAPRTGDDRIGHELSELPCGIFGLGAIGSAVARRLRLGFGCEVSAFDIATTDIASSEGVVRSRSLGELLAASRLVFVHVPLNESSRTALDEPMLRTMPRGSFLVNCARGGIVDEASLARCLADGHLAGAASDVFATEPPPADHPLLGCPRFLATPHLGAATHRGLERVGLAIAHKVLDALAGGSDRAPRRGERT